MPRRARRWLASLALRDGVGCLDSMTLGVLAPAGEQDAECASRYEGEAGPYLERQRPGSGVGQNRFGRRWNSRCRWCGGRRGAAGFDDRQGVDVVDGEGERGTGLVDGEAAGHRDVRHAARAGTGLAHLLA